MTALASLLCGVAASAILKGGGGGGYIPIYPTAVVNPGAESDGLGWTFSDPSRITYGTSFRGVTPRTGSKLFGSGLVFSGDYSISQYVSVDPSKVAAVDSGWAEVALGRWLNAADYDKDGSYVKIEFYNGADVLIGSVKGDVVQVPKLSWAYFEDVFKVPATTRYMNIFLVIGRFVQNYVSVAIDDVTLAVTARPNNITASGARVLGVFGAVPDSVTVQGARVLGIIIP